jgi:hypothetical protein
MHKGYAYYRCQTISCPTTAVREEAVDAAFRSMIAPLRFGKTEQDVLFADIQALDGANAVLRTSGMSWTLRRPNRRPAVGRAFLPCL